MVSVKSASRYITSAYVITRVIKVDPRLFPRDFAESAEAVSIVLLVCCVFQTALAEFGNIVWINPDYEVVSAEFGHLVHHSHQNGATVIAEEMPFSTYAVTNPSMYDFIQVDKDRLRRHKHLEIRAMILHNTPEIAANILRPLTVCSLEEACLQPPGTSKLGCRFDYTGTKYAGCHKNEESALNILFKKHFDFDMELFYKPYPNMFRRFDESMLRIPKLLKICEDDKDLKENRDL